MDHVLWIGGGSGAGKSTVAARLAVDHDLTTYSTDAAISHHIEVASPDSIPLMSRFMAMNLDQRWVERSPSDMLDTFGWFAGEGFDLLVDDLAEQPSAGRPVVVEGFRLLPRLVAPFLVDPPRGAVWMLPTPAFRRVVLEQRMVEDSHFLNRTSEPERALANLLERDRLFTERVRTEVAALGLHAVVIDGTLSEDEVVATVADRLGLG